MAEIKLDLAILKYARFARGGRFTPAKISELFDQTPQLRDPKLVLSDIEATDAPDAYLRSLHPKHEQFARLRQALLKARGPREEGAKPAAGDKDTKRIIINMERWRWMPEELGSLYVWNNSPEFMLYVVKDGKPIFGDKTLVGTIGYATPVFTSPMTTIVFNPDWVAPETVVKENIWPPLQKGSYSILKIHKLYVSYNGKPVDPTKVDWNRVNPLSYTFSQKAGPHNNLGKVKFLFPNRHTVYMHDTLPVRKKYFKESARLIGHECVRMEKPVRFAEILLAEANGWPDSRVKELWDKRQQQRGRAREEDPGAHGLFHGGGGRQRQGRDLRRFLRARPQAGGGAVRRRYGISPAAARAAQAPIARSRRHAGQSERGRGRLHELDAGLSRRMT